MMKMDLQFAGSAVGIQWDCEPAARLVDFLFRPSWEMGSQTSTPAPDPEVTFQICCEGSGETLVITSNQGDRMQGSPVEIAYFLVERVTYHLADRSRAGLLLHAACMAKNGIALALPGTSGSGKSTLALWLARQGFDYLTDELLFIPTGSLDCRGLARPVHLRTAASGLFNGFSEENILPPPGDAPTAGWMVHPKSAVPEAHLTAILFPRYEKNADFTFQRLPGAQAALTLTGSMVNARNLPDNGFPELLRLVRAVPAYSMTYANFDPVLHALQNIAAASSQ
jgi:hypothetical protein